MVTHTCAILEYSGYTHFPRPAEQYDNYDYDKDYDDDVGGDDDDDETGDKNYDGDNQTTRRSFSFAKLTV